MRDILDKISNLSESTGLAGRKTGDLFKNAKGDTITFKDISFYPVEGGVAEPQDLNSELEKINNQIQIKWQNKKTSRTGGFIIASFDSPSGELNYGFYKEFIKANKPDNYVPNQVDDYKFFGKTGEKVRATLTPQDLLAVKDNLTAIDIVDQLSKKLGKDNPLVEVTRRLASGEQLPISFLKPNNVSFSAFRDYFCEILQPIALQNDQFTGNAGEAAEKFMDGSFENTLISFDETKTAGLSDSILSTKDGKYIKISTKGGAKAQGAQASVKNLYDSLLELQNTENGIKLQEKYKDIIELVQEINKKGQSLAPLYLGVKFDIITDSEAETIKNLRNTKPINLDEIEKLNISDNLKKLALDRKTAERKNLNLYYHLIASVANLVANKINDETNFSKAAADILNNGALVQVYTKAKEKGDNWVIENFQTLYPGTTINNVLISAKKNYYSTGIKGGFTFKINKEKKEEENVEKDISQDVSTPIDLQKAATLITKGVAEPISMAPSGTGIGREKRK